MDAALVAAAGIAASIVGGHGTIGLCSVAFFGATYSPGAQAVWRGIRLALVCCSAPVGIYDTAIRHKGGEAALSVVLELIAVAIATGDSFSTGTIYPFLVCFGGALGDVAIAASSKANPYLKNSDQHS